MLHLVDTYFWANTDTNQLQEKITRLKALESELTVFRDVAVQGCQERDERIQTLEAQLRERETMEMDLRAALEATDFERAKANSNLEAKVEELACSFKQITLLEAQVASMRTEA